MPNYNISSNKCSHNRCIENSMDKGVANRRNLYFYFRPWRTWDAKKLVIDQSKAPGKIGTLKDMWLFGSFKFPCNRPKAGGIVTKSLAGQRKSLSNTKAQVQTLSMWSIPLAGATVATVTEEVATIRPKVGCEYKFTKWFILCAVHSALYSYPGELVLVPWNEASVNNDLRSALGLALKRGGAKKTTFTNEQKEIMIQFWVPKVISDKGQSSRC